MKIVDEKRGILKEILYLMKHGAALEIERPRVSEEQEKTVKQTMELTFSGKGEKPNSTIWQEFKPKHINKIMEIIGTESVYNTLGHYEGKNKLKIAKEMWYMADQDFVMLDAFAELMGEKLIFDICNKNGPEFTRAFIHIFESEFTQLMRPDYVLADAKDRVAYTAALAIGNREGESAKARLETIVKYIDGMGNDSNLFSSSNMIDIIEEAKSHLNSMIKEDQVNQNIKRE